jgi:hypothetical protein
MAATPSRISFRNPELTATATMMTKKLTAIAIAATFP